MALPKIGFSEMRFEAKVQRQVLGAADALNVRSKSWQDRATIRCARRGGRAVEDVSEASGSEVPESVWIFYTNQIVDISPDDALLVGTDRYNIIKGFDIDGTGRMMKIITEDVPERVDYA